MVDLLRTESNERIDIQDFQFLAEESLSELGRVVPSSIFTNPTSPNRSWIFQGFETLNPTGKQLTVMNGIAILGERKGGRTQFGVVSIGGDSQKTIDLASFPAGRYGIFVRFERISAEPASRVFWSPAGNGTEIVKTIPTRHKANWSLRVERVNPGVEWLRIGRVDQATMTITDERPLYFEGRPDKRYRSGWGEGFDRDDNRAMHGIRDLQTFVQAFQTIVEEFRGGGRRWWQPGQVEARYERGVAIGHEGQIDDRRLSVGDANFHLGMIVDNPYIQFDSNGDRIVFARHQDRIHLKIANKAAATIGRTDITVGGRIRLDVSSPNRPFLNLGLQTDAHPSGLYLDVPKKELSLRLHKVGRLVLDADSVSFKEYPNATSNMDLGADKKRWGTVHATSISLRSHQFGASSELVKDDIPSLRGIVLRWGDVRSAKNIRSVTWTPGEECIVEQERVRGSIPVVTPYVSDGFLCATVSRGKAGKTWLVRIFDMDKPHHRLVRKPFSIVAFGT